MSQLFSKTAALLALGATALAAPNLALSQTVSAAPSLMNFQGRLATPSGNPVPDGTYTVTFSLWNALTGGTKQWEQIFTNNVTVRNGTFSVLLNTGSGLQNGATATTLFNGNLWLQTQIGADTALSLRQPLVSNAYAFKANSVADNAITANSIANGTITAAKLAAGVAFPGATAGGDLTGFYPNPLIKNDATLLYKVSGSLMSALGGSNSVDQQQSLFTEIEPDFAWQSFTASQAGQLTSLDLYIGTTTGLTKTIPLILKSGEGISGTELGRVTVTVAPTYGWQTFTFNVPLPLTGGQKYTWTMGTSSSLKFGYTRNNPYPSGRADIGDTFDYAFRTYLGVGNSAQINVAAKLNINDTLRMSTAKSINLTDETFAYRTNNVPFYGLGWYLDGESASGSPSSYLSSYDTIKLFTIGQPRLSVTGSGNVGIGTTLPTQKLDVLGNAAVSGSVTAASASLSGAFSAASATIPVFNGSATFGGNALFSGAITPSAGNSSLKGIMFPPDPGGGTGDTAYMRYYAQSGESAVLELGTTNDSDDHIALMPSGNVGIGTTSPVQKLAVNGNAYVSGTVGIGDTNPFTRLSIDASSGDYITGIRIRTRRENYAGEIPAILLDNVGDNRVSIGMTVTNEGRLRVQNQFGVFNAGYATLNDNGSWSSSSDRRLKTEIEPLTGLLEKTLALRPVNYFFKATNRDEHPLKEMGFIAQEVEEIFPSLVGGKGNDMKSLNYSGLSVAAIGAVQELNRKLEKQNTELRTEVADLKARFAAMEAVMAELKVQHK